MGILKHLNWKYNSSLPYALGDRYYSQDLIRDFRYIQDVVGNLAYDVFGQVIPRKISGGVVTKGSGDTLNITAGRGWAAFNVTIPDTFSSLPPSTTTADITAVPVVWTQQTNMALAGATLNGSAVNYVKVRYTETNGNTRTRAKALGTYSYETTDSFTFIVDTVAPTVYDLVLTTFTGTAGGEFTIADSTYTYPYWSTLSSIPVGSSIDFSGTVIPTGWMIEDGSSLLRADYPALYSSLTAISGAVTISIASPGVVSLTNHPYQTGDCIHLTTTGALPTGLSANTNYYVIVNDADTFWLATTFANALAGTKINTSGTQSGTHTLTWIPWGAADGTHFYLPDMGGLSSEGSSQLTTNGASWGGANYRGRLGQYKQDQMQGHKHSASVPAYAGTNTNKITAQSGSSFVANIAVVVSDPIDDGVHGTPRTGAITASPRAGKFKIIKVI